jgi:hypothetical protein
MCATDLASDLATELDLELDIAEDEQATGPQPIGGHYAGVAWGLAERPGDPAERPGAPAAGDPVTGDPAAG